MALSRIDIFNLALDQLPTTRIETLDDGFEADVCAGAYQPSLQTLLEAHHWDFAIRRQTLAVAANDRGAEWSYAYAAPDQMITPRYLLPYGSDYDASGNPTYPNFGRLRAYEGVQPFRIARGLIYANLENGVFEYVSGDVSEEQFPSLFAEALALKIAARIVMPIKKDRKRQGDLIQMAEVAKERAKAADMNRDRESVRDFIPEGQLVRAGILPWQ